MTGMRPCTGYFTYYTLSTIISYLGALLYSRSDESAVLFRNKRTHYVDWYGFMLLLRLIYLGQAQLIPDEAYYWNYAQHMDLSFTIIRPWLRG